MRDWRTTIFGLVSAAAAFVAFADDLGWPLWAVRLAQFVLAGGLAGLGVVARDYRARERGGREQGGKVRTLPVKRG